MSTSISRLLHFDPLGDLADLRGNVDRVLTTMAGNGTGTLPLPLDVIRNDDRLVVRADVPGVRPDEVKIEVENDTLTISVHHEEASETSTDSYVRRERIVGSFSRSITVPPGTDPSQIKATTRDGVVEVDIPLPPGVKKEKVQITPTAG